jgi:hypothetical protein
MNLRVRGHVGEKNMKKGMSKERNLKRRKESGK